MPGGSVVEVVVFTGIQASGKSTFYAQHLLHSHVRVSLDVMRTRHREKRLYEICLEIAQPVVIDNTNPSREERARYIQPAKERGFRVVGYYFASSIQDSLARNRQREGARRIPDQGVRGTHARLVVPSYDEGFDTLYSVRLLDDQFVLEVWPQNT
jgi:predicted kinase